MTVCYFDVDDEITNAVSRVRAADSSLVTLVLPPGSRIATSRINFLILAREARSRSRTLAVVSGEPGVRALAVSAGLPAYPTVEESERALSSSAVPMSDVGGPGTADRGRAAWPGTATAPGGATATPVSGGGAGGAARGNRGLSGPGRPGEVSPDGLWAPFEANAPAEADVAALTSAGSTDLASAGAGLVGHASARTGAAEPAVAGPTGHAPAAAAADIPTPAATVTAAPPADEPRAREGASDRLRKVMARPMPEPAASSIAAAGSASQGSPELGSNWRDDPWRDPRGRGREPEPAVAPRSSEGRSVTPHSAAIDAGSTAAGTETSMRARAAEDHIRSRGRMRRRVSLGVRLMVVLAILGVALGGLYFYLPTADITLTPRTQVAGPVSLTVVADPALAVVDTARARIPAEKVDVPLRVSDSFPATGTAVTLTRAAGTARFTSVNTVFDVTVPDGTRVSTRNGIAFETRQEIVLQKAIFGGSPTERNVAIQAVQTGPAGNVPGGAITRLSETLTSSQVSVTNPQATSGGRRIEAKQIQKKDYDAAIKTLNARLPAELADKVKDPAIARPGLTIHPATGTVADPQPDQAASDVVGTKATSFTLTLSATGTVLAVDRALVERLAVDRLTAGIPAGARLLDGTIVTTIGDPSIQSGTIRYTVQARAQQWRPVEASTIITAVRGRSIKEARTTLEQYGTADLQHWPEFLDSMPSQDFRISVAVREPTAP